MRQDLERLAKASAGLDPTATQRARWVEAVTTHAEEWIRSLPDLPAHIEDDETAMEVLVDQTFAGGPSDIEDLLAALAEGVERPGIGPVG